ncbi:glycosyltransferase family 4 protein [Janibacter sp. GS2]|uniref:glycosyltransferase family 4 protein n=1 Tax=Janibacter sp. GS2 TaxID=3442646 RepID=UPI003EBF112F
MSPSRPRRRRVRSHLLRLARHAPATVLRSAALVARLARDDERTLRLLRRLAATGGVTASECVRWTTAARTAGSQEELLRAQRTLLTLTPATDHALNRSVRALHDLDPRHWPEVEAWSRTIADRRPDVDRTAPERLVLRMRVDLLRLDGGAAPLIHRHLRDHHFDELEDLVCAFTPDVSATVDAELWTLVSKRALAFGWTTLAAVAISRLEGESDEAQRRLVAEAEDERDLLASPWAPPSAAAPSAGARSDPRSVLSVLGQSLPLRSGGYATRSHGILTGLAHRGWKMSAVTRPGFPFDLWWSADDERQPAAVDVVDGIPYHRLLTDGVRHYPRVPLRPYVEDGARGIATLARQERAALIHAASLYDVGMAGLTAARALGVPFVYEMRGLKQLLEEARHPLFATSPRRDYLDLLEGTVARNADALLVITEALGREMVALGVDPDRITVVPNGVDASRFTPRPRHEHLAERLGLSGKTVIGYIGGLVHYEGLELLFSAVQQLRDRRGDFHVLVVGDGAYQRTLHRAVETRDLHDLVTFTGRVPHEDVEDYLSLVDITPFPRKPLKVCELISPIKPFEAMAMRKTIVASDVAALTEIVTDGVTGRLFAKGDASDLARVLDELLDSPQERERLGTAAREWVVAERDWHRITGIVEGVYRELLDDRTDS